MLNFDHIPSHFKIKTNRPVEFFTFLFLKNNVLIHRQIHLKMEFNSPLSNGSKSRYVVPVFVLIFLGVLSNVCTTTFHTEHDCRMPEVFHFNLQSMPV